MATKNNSFGCLFLVFCLAGLYGLVLLSRQPPSSITPPPAPLPAAQTEPQPDVRPPVVAKPRTIPGIAAVDLTGNLEKRGFTVTKRLDLEQNEWKCRLKIGQTDFLAEAFGSSASEITVISAIALGPQNELAVEFLQFIATLPFDGNNPVFAKKWVARNFGKNATTTINSCEFRLSSSEFASILRIAPRAQD